MGGETWNVPSEYWGPSPPGPQCPHLNMVSHLPERDTTDEIHHGHCLGLDGERGIGVRWGTLGRVWSTSLNFVHEE